MIAEVLQGREEVVAQPIFRRRGRRRCLGLDAELRHAVLEFEHDALRGLLADAGDTREPRHVGALDADHEVAGLHA